MSTTTRTAALAACLAAGAFLGLPAAGASPVAAPSGAKVLADGFGGLLGAAHAVDDGPVAATMPMTVGVWIPGDAAGLEAYASAVTDPASAAFGRTLTPAQVHDRFGVDRVVGAATRRQLEGHGLKPVYVAAGGDYVELTGTAAQVQQTFAVTVDDVVVAGVHHFANLNGATVPAPVGAVLGLTDLTDMHAAALQSPGNEQSQCDTRQPGVCAGGTSGQGISSVYDAPRSISSTGGEVYDPTDHTTDYGQGQRIAIFGEGDLAAPVAALRAAEDATTLAASTAVAGQQPLSGAAGPLGAIDQDIAKAAIPHVPVREVLVNDPQGPSADTSNATEWELDSQSSTEVAPLLSELDFYFGGNFTDQSIAGAYSAWVDDPNGPSIGNSSFGGCETFQQLSGGEPTTDALLAQGVVEGRSMFVSTGDSGAAGCTVLPVNVGEPNAPGVQSPASSAFVTAVGGTSLWSRSSGATAPGVQVQPPARAREFAWYDSTGGYAGFSAMPASQRSVLAGGRTTLPTTTTCVQPSGVACREVPDVSAMSGLSTRGDNFREVTCTAATAGQPPFTCGTVGVVGTSLSSPVWAGTWALVAAAHRTDGSCHTAVPASAQAGLGFAQPLLYQLAASATSDARDFFDVGGTDPTTGNPSANYLYPTLPRGPLDPTGYDLVTGLGSPDISEMIADLDCTTTPVAEAEAPSDVPITVDATAATSCPTGWVQRQPAGHTPTAVNASNDPGVNLAKASVAGDATGVTFSLATAGAPASAATDDSFVTVFGWGGVLYGVTVDPGGLTGFGEAGATPTPGTPAYRLITLGVPVVGSPVFAGTFLGTLTGAADTAHGTYTVRLPYGAFDADAAAVSGFTPLVPTGALAPVEVLSGQQPSFSAYAAQEVVSDTLQWTCVQQLSAVQPQPQPAPGLPDSPVPAGMVAVGALGGVAVAIRRRRRA